MNVKEFVVPDVNHIIVVDVPNTLWFMHLELRRGATECNCLASMSCFKRQEE